VWLLHGDDDKLVSLRESIALSQCFKYAFGPMILSQCGHIPFQERPSHFVKVIGDIINGDLKRFKMRSPSESQEVEADSPNFLNQGAHRIKEMLSSIGVHRGNQSRSNINMFDSAALASSIVAPNEDSLSVAVADDVLMAPDPSDADGSKVISTPKVTEKSALLHD